MVQTYIDQHSELVELGRAIITQAIRNTPASLDEVARLRLALAKAVQQHVSAEIALIRRERPDADETHSPAIMGRYHDELLAWRKLLMECNAAWPLKLISIDPRGFVEAYRPILRSLEERVLWEEEVFYPVVLSRAHLRLPAVSGS